MSVRHWLKREIQTVRSSRLDNPKKFFVTLVTQDNQACCAMGQATVNTATLNLRLQPSLTAPIIGKLARGTIVDVWSIANNWYWVQTQVPPYLTGWCSSGYLSLTQPLRA